MLDVLFISLVLPFYLFYLSWHQMHLDLNNNVITISRSSIANIMKDYFTGSNYKSVCYLRNIGMEMLGAHSNRTLSLALSYDKDHWLLCSSGINISPTPNRSEQQAPSSRFHLRKAQILPVELLLPVSPSHKSFSEYLATSLLRDASSHVGLCSHITKTQTVFCCPGNVYM
jgi:hypothetical protein